jgi:hypothetical protein
MPKVSVRLRWSRIDIDEARDLKLIVSLRDFLSLAPRAEPGYYRGFDGQSAITVRVVADAA